MKQQMPFTRNICSASDLETAMLRGVNYPQRAFTVG